MWHGIEGHDDVVERFRRTLKRDRLASTYLFVGPPGIGKRRFALQLAHGLLCSQSNDASLEACGHCESCRLFAAGNHPDLELIGLPKDKTKLPIELFVGDRDHRHQQGLCHRMALKPFLAGRKIAIIDDADHFNQESANCLLKTLEEPPEHLLLILIGTSPSRQLPTIRSRAQVVGFQPLDSETVMRILLEAGLLHNPDAAKKAAELSEGSVERALHLADPGLWAFREQLFAELRSPATVRLARAVQAFVDEAGKETSRKRERLRTVLDFAVSFFRQRLSGPNINHDRHQLAYSTGHVDAALEALEASLAALEHIDRNANLAMVIQQWSEEMGAQSKSTSTLSPA